MTVNGLKCGLDSDNSPFYLKAFLLEPVCQDLLGMELFHSDLRMVEDVIRHLRHLVPDLIDLPEHDFLQHKKAPPSFDT